MTKYTPKNMLCVTKCYQRPHKNKIHVARSLKSAYHYKKKGYLGGAKSVSNTQKPCQIQFGTGLARFLVNLKFEGAKYIWIGLMLCQIVFGTGFGTILLLCALSWYLARLVILKCTFNTFFLVPNTYLVRHLPRA